MTRRRLPKRILAVLVIALVSLISYALPQETVTGTARIVDGDTLNINGQSIRLFGVDAPEKRQTCQRQGVGYSCGLMATDTLRSITAGRAVRCLVMTHDKYGRSVARCEVNGESLNKALVRSGLALAYYQYGGWVYTLDEMEARANKAGVWAGSFETPWDYRHRRRKGYR